MPPKRVEAINRHEISPLSNQHAGPTAGSCPSKNTTRARRVSIAHYFLMLACCWSMCCITSSTSGFAVAFISVPQRQNQDKVRAMSALLSSVEFSSPQIEFESSHLDELEQTVNNVLQKASLQESLPEEEKVAVPIQDREAMGVANHLQKRIDYLRRTNSCRRCWMHREQHCVCSQCPPLEAADSWREQEGSSNGETQNTNEKQRPLLGKVKRVFLLQHHKEIGMVVDTAKFITAAFPESCQLVVNGIGPDYQPSMRDMLDSIEGRDANRNCLVLFPAEGAKTFDELVQMKEDETIEAKTIRQDEFTDFVVDEKPFDLIVIDGTWSQARKMHARYMPRMENGGCQRVCLSKEALAILGGTQDWDDNNTTENGTMNGHQLRRHSIEWKKVSTFEAARLFLRDMDSKGEHTEQWNTLARYQQIGDNAAMRQLGPPRYPLVQ